MIYVINEHNSDNYKIGFTAGDPRARLTALQTGNPSKLTLFAIIEGDINKEKELHKDLQSRRTIGEWFQFSSEEIIEFIYSQGGKLEREVSFSKDVERYKKSLEIMVSELAELKNKIESLKKEKENSDLSKLRKLLGNSAFQKCQKNIKVCFPILFLLFLHSDNDKKYQISSVELGKLVGCSKPTVQKAISLLEGENLIRKFSDGKRACSYEILL